MYNRPDAVNGTTGQERGIWIRKDNVQEDHIPSYRRLHISAFHSDRKRKIMASLCVLSDSLYEPRQPGLKLACMAGDTRATG
jgi:hypothetical protein